MERSSAPKRNHLYCIERFWDISPGFELSEESYDKGRQFVEGLGLLNEAFKDIGDSRKYSDFFIKVLDSGIMVVEPAFPIQRTVQKWGNIYMNMAPPETTESDDPLLIDHFKVFADAETNRLLVRGISPMYRSLDDGPGVEEISVFDPTKHKIAIQPCAAEIFDSL